MVLGVLFSDIMPMPAHAVDPTSHVTQYAHTSWRVQDGSFRGSPSALTQTADGYLWIGTLGGVYRFDGVKLVLAGFSEGNQLRSPRVVSLLAARDGSLWIGTGSDLEHWHDNQLTHYSESLGFISGIAERPQGSIWFTRDRTNDGLGAICQVVREHTRCFGKSAGIETPNSGMSGLPQDASGHLWFGDNRTIYQWDPIESRLVSTLAVPESNGDQTLAALQFDPTGKLLIGSQQVGDTGLLLYDGKETRPYASLAGHIASLSVSCLLVDRQGSLWIGTDNSGLYRIVRGHVEHYGTTDGLSGEGVNALYEDTEGNIWVATVGGLDRFRDLRIITYSTREGLSSDQVNAVVGRRDGSVWLSNLHSLDAIKDGAVSSIRAGSGLPGSEVGPLFEDHRGALWVGIDEALFMYDNNRFTEVIPNNPKQNYSIRSITEDKSGEIWALNDSGRLFGIRDGKVVKELTNSPDHFAITPAITPDAENGIWLLTKNMDFMHVSSTEVSRVQFHRAPNAANVYALITAADGSILGSSAVGVVAVLGGVARTLGLANGLPCPHVWSLIQDRDDSLWLYTECGLLVIKQHEWLKWWSHPTEHIRFKVIDSREGAQPANTFFGPSSSRSADGRLWFANSFVAQTVDPVSLNKSPAFAPIHIEQVVADRHTFSPVSAAHLPPNPKSLQIDYTAPSFSLASKIRFRYRLVGHDESWVDAGSRRQAFYNDLPPGHFQFEVAASNSDGDWDGRSARIDLDVAPTFYQTRWFLAACIAALGIFAWLLYHMRIRQLAERIQLRVEARLVERERIARDLHDTLLQGVQGLIYTFHAGVERLPTAEPTRATLEAALVRADGLLSEGRAQVMGLRREASNPDSIETRLAALISNLDPTMSAKVHVTSIGEPRPIQSTAAEEIARIAGEAIQNAVNHASPEEIAVQLHYNEAEFLLCVRDDGRGFDAGRFKEASPIGHFGLLGMSERAARLDADLQISSREFAGTVVILKVRQERVYSSHPIPRKWMRISRLWQLPSDLE
jgi:signal transduction histidine kinase/ligand-binding sensor domain-containing protein